MPSNECFGLGLAWCCHPKKKIREGGGSRGKASWLSDVWRANSCVSLVMCAAVLKSTPLLELRQELEASDAAVSRVKFLRLLAKNNNQKKNPKSSAKIAVRTEDPASPGPTGITQADV